MQNKIKLIVTLFKYRSQFVGNCGEWHFDLAQKLHTLSVKEPENI